MHRLTRIASPVFLCVGLLASLLPLALWWSGDAPPFLGRWSWVLGVVGLGIAFHPHAAQRRAAGTFRGARVWLVLGVLSLALYRFALPAVTASPPAQRAGPRVQIGFGLAPWSLTAGGREMVLREDLHTPQELLLAIGAFHEDGGKAAEVWSSWSIACAGLLLVVLAGGSTLALLFAFLRLAELLGPAAASSASLRRKPDPAAAGDGRPRGLVVLVPGFSNGLAGWQELIERLGQEEELRGYRWLPFDHRFRWYHRARMASIARSLRARIHAEWVRQRPTDEQRADGKPFEIVLVGHSMGGLLVREAYLQARGFGGPGTHPEEWADSVRRIVLFAAPNRGIDPSGSLLLGAGCRLLRLRGFRRLLLADLLRGAAFITNLRIRWIRHFVAAGSAAPSVVQLLGDHDGLVKPDDSIDLEQLPTARHVTVPGAGHGDLHRLDRAEEPAARYALLRHEMIGPAAAAPAGAEAPPAAPRRFVFLLHGIRSGADTWVEDLRQRIEKLDPETEVVRCSYPWVSALTFALPVTRRKHLHHFQDLYSQCLARNPRAEFHFIGHSNGTYLLGQSLQQIPALRFRRVALVGSVLPRKFPWKECFDRGQVEQLVNHRSDRDFPVAVLCSALRGLWMRDVGPGGFLGFFTSHGPRFEELFWYRGGHGAALAGGNLDALARFALGHPMEPPPVLSKEYPRGYAFLSRVAPWLAAAAVLTAIALWGQWVFTPTFSQDRLLWSSAGLGGFLCALHLF